VICGGYNDAAHVIAFTVADSIQSFVDLMNQKATELAMTSTTYLNPTGIYVNGMRSTIGDIAILVSHMAKNKKFVEICSTKSYRISSESSCEYRTINNRSTLLSSYSGLSNFNTGSGDLGDCAVLYYNKNGHSLICIVMNAKSNDYNDNTNYAETFAKQLLNHALNDYSYKTVMDINTVVTTQTVNYSIDYSSLNVYLKNDLKVFVSDDIDVENHLSYSINLYNSTLKAPISAGDEVGTITVIYDGRILATAPLIVKQDVSKNGLLFTLGLLREYFISRHFLLTIFTFILLLLGL
jgi:D-alanyl-D-alanine carboxypeptidase (penicillin-binding protein 5/6)